MTTRHPEGFLIHGLTHENQAECGMMSSIADNSRCHRSKELQYVNDRVHSNMPSIADMENGVRLRTPSDFGAAIREKRRSLGLNQATLAARVGVSRQWVVEAEKGKPRAAMNLVLRTLDELGISLWTDASRPAATPRALPGATVSLDRVVDAHRSTGE